MWDVGKLEVGWKGMNDITIGVHVAAGAADAGAVVSIYPFFSLELASLY